MFRIGEFSKIAQVSGRMLRHYDQLGLLKPEHIDPQTGYRFYTAQQLPRLNRILSLKELGLSLEQIARLLNESISTDEIRGMLVMKKAQLEQMLNEEIARFRYIESRIEQIDNEGNLEDYDVVLKSIPQQRYLSLRETCNSFDHARSMMMDISKLLPRKVGSKTLGQFVVVMHSEIMEMEDVDLELGYILETDFDDNVTLSNGTSLTVRELPAVESVITVTRLGIAKYGCGSYATVGMWADANNYRLLAPNREVFLQLPYPGKEEETVTEIQYPVEKIMGDNLLLN